jgi:hypothetical protein
MILANHIVERPCWSATFHALSIMYTSMVPTSWCSYPSRKYWRCTHAPHPILLFTANCIGNHVRNHALTKEQLVVVYYRSYLLGARAMDVIGEPHGGELAVGSSGGPR